MQFDNKNCRSSKGLTMSSILTNPSSLVALQTLKTINMGLNKTQSEISTGKSIASAKDNSAAWAISKIMESDVSGFKAISESLALGESTVAVARQASETVTDLLTDIKGKVVAAQEENVDRSKIQTDIDALSSQISSIVGAAQFNGLNLLSGTDDVNVLSSLDRASDGTVSASNITVTRQDLSTTAGTIGTGTSLTSNVTIAGSATAVASAGNTGTVVIDTDADVNADAYSFSIAGETIAITGTSGQDQDDIAASLNSAINALGLTGISSSVSTGTVTITSTRAFEDVSLVGTKNGGSGVTIASATIGERAESLTFSTAATVNEGDGYSVTVGSTAYSYIAGNNESMSDVAAGLKTAIDNGSVSGVTVQATTDSAGASVLKIDNDGTGSSSLALAVSGAADGTASGGMFGLGGINVTTDAGAASALSNIETLINNSIDAAASFGSVQGRLETQASFISKLTDSLNVGIGTLIDANMEEASARLQALQVQQQLGIQSLSIANQAPQNILSLFR
jgi:flagellin